MGSSLPSKEANLFKLVVKSYETKQYKKGLKAADQILKKFPEHGETLAMKGLTLNCMDRKEEAYELVRKGLKNDLKSHVCWHVYGLLYRSDREYREAIKCYRNALKIDPENIQILRDLSLLQAQMRDLAGFVETRRILLTLKPNNRNNWIGFAIAHHLNSNPGKAVDILEAYEGTLEEDYPQGSVDDESSHNNEKYEHSEMLLYKASLLDESGAFEKALDELDKKSAKIVDKLGLKEQYASLLIKLSRYEQAAENYHFLLKFNSDNYRYYEKLEECLGISSGRRNTLTAEQVRKLVDLYDQLRKEFPGSAAVKRIPLDFLEMEAFRKAADDYVRPFLRKGVVSLFSDLRPLYDHPSKADILEEIFIQIENSLRASQTFPASSEQEPPSTLLWTLLLLAQHYDRRCQIDKALLKIDEAITHTPTIVDLYLVKGRILKHAGNFVAAAAVADEARSMDLADRYTNSECVKRMLQADQVELAEKTALLFTKDADHNLYDMQCMWYEVASGDSYFRRGALGRALKKFLAVEKHYADMVEDQFDFHTYCLRKMTLRAYIDMLRFQDHLHSHRFFHRAAAASIRCYLKLYDSPPKPSVEDDEAAITGLPAAERKKIQKRQRKLENRAKREAEERAKEEESSNSVTSKGGKKACQISKPVDIDPDGEKLIQVNDPLNEATRYLRLLQEHSSEVLETHLLAFEVHIRKRRFLLALQAVKRQLRLDPHDADVHRCLIRFFHIIDSLDPPETVAEELVRSVIDTERTSIECLAGKSLLETNKSFFDQHTDSLWHRAVAAEILYLLSPDEKSIALEIIESSVNKPSAGGTALGDGVGEWELKDCILIHKLLESMFADVEASTKWRLRCAELFPYSTYFQGLKSSNVDGRMTSQNKVMVSSEDIIHAANSDNIGIENLKL